jgi:hypothetical protein
MQAAMTAQRTGVDRLEPNVPIWSLGPSGGLVGGCTLTQ